MKRLMISFALLAGLGTAQDARADNDENRTINPRLLRRFKPIRAEIDSTNNPVTVAKTDLGRVLYFDKRMSVNQQLSCNSCHPLDKYGADGEATSKGHDGKRGRRNSPTVYHAAAAFTQFWDGRAADVEEQAKGPILNPAEMGMKNPQQVVALLKAIPGYGPLFAKAFPSEPDPITYDNVGRALGAFERRLVTPARWDAFLEGKKDALTPEEIEGLHVFSNVGCMVCHTGELLGGSMYQKLGAVEAWPNQADRGRAEATKTASDDMVFKVPTLRNVAMTGPYFHDGSAKTLTDAVTLMGRHQLGLELSADEIASIVAWLGSLTGELPQAYIQPPALPASPAGAARVER